jgi:phosphonopyruvate decarboxylase
MSSRTSVQIRPSSAPRTRRRGPAADRPPAPASSSSAAVARCSEVALLDAFTRRGIRDIVSVPCSITDTWHALAAERARAGELRLVMASHEMNLAGIAGGVWFATGRPALVHMQNSGLPNAADGIVSFADPEVHGIPMAAMVTFRGATPDDTSEPHQAIGRRTEALVRAVFGPGSTIAGCRTGAGLLAAAEAVADAAVAGSIGVLQVAEAGLARTHRPSLPELADGRRLLPVAAIRAAKGAGSAPAALRGADGVSREDAIRAIAAAHPAAALLFSNGYTARAAQAFVDDARCFHNVGYMGGTLAIAWSLAKRAPWLEVVVVDGDQNALMSAMKDQLVSDYPPNLHWYILDNGIGASVGVSASMPLGPVYDDLARVVRTRPDEPGSFALPRVSAPGGLPLSALARRFRGWIAARAPSVFR